MLSLWQAVDKNCFHKGSILNLTYFFIFIFTIIYKLNKIVIRNKGKKVMQLKIDIIKCHGSGNDFILIDERSNSCDFSDSQRRDLTIKLCNRKEAIGADGILFVQKSESCNAKMRIFNSDGTEAEMCGNGIRCVGRYVMDLINSNEAIIETMKSKYRVLRVEDIFKNVNTVKIFIESVDFNVNSLPMIYSNNELIFENIFELTNEFKFSAVSITNPHIIAILDKIDENLLVNIGKRANNLPNIFPKGVNISFVKIINKKNIYVKTFERGVGLTKSCGTGMTASSIITCLGGYTDYSSEICIFNDGGMIKCIVNKELKVQFIGNATYIYRSILEPERIDMYEKFNSIKELYEMESRAYNSFLDYTKNTINKIR